MGQVRTTDLNATTFKIASRRPVLVQRYLLREDPSIDIEKFRQFNFEARKIAMIVTFLGKSRADDIEKSSSSSSSAITSTKPNLLTLLYLTNTDIYRVILIFL